MYNTEDQTKNLKSEEDDQYQEMEYSSGTSFLKRRKKLLIIIGSSLLVVILIIVLAVSLSGGGDSPGPGPGPDPPHPIPEVYKFCPYYKESQTSAKFREEWTLTHAKLKPEVGIHANYGEDDIKNTTDNIEAQRLKVRVESLDDHTYRVRIVDADHERWEVPNDFNMKYEDFWISEFQHSPLKDKLTVVNDPFFFELKGNSGNDPIFSTKYKRLRFFDKYIEMQAELQTNRMFGMGERIHDFALTDGVYTLFNKNQYTVETGTPPGHNMFGSHPFYLTQLKNRKFMGVYMLNSNAQDFSIQTTPENNTAVVTHKMIGGVIDMLIFHDEDANSILRRYHTKINPTCLLSGSWISLR